MAAGRLGVVALLAPGLPVVACGHGPGATSSSLAFSKQVIDPAYRSEGVAVADVNRDGVPDVVTDQYWYEGPGFAPHEIRAPETYDPAAGFANGFAVYPQDVDHDGWLDLVVAPHPGDAMLWYKNPLQGGDAHWTPYSLAPAGVAGLETPVVADLFADGRSILVMTDIVTGVLAWFEPGTDPTQAWVEHAISAPGFPGAALFTHGMGTGDVDGDGRLDLLTGYGWFQQTSDPAAWVEHAFSFGPNPDACSTMFAHDVDGDGLADVLCARPHDYGLYWWKQAPNAPGADPTFAASAIDMTISQMHVVRLDDLDGDGVPEIVTGKTFWAHVPPGDPGENDPAVLAYYTLQRGPGGPTFARHDVDEDSGVGRGFAIADLNGDGKPDIVTANKKGLAYFLRQ